MKNLFVKDITDGVEGKSEEFVVDEIRQHKTKAGKPFYRLVLKDKTGTIGARIWSDYFPFCEIGEIKPGDVVEVDFYAEEYGGDLQLIVTKLKLAQEFDPSNFLKSSNKSVNELLSQLYYYIENVKSEGLKQLLTSIFQDESLLEKIKVIPAGEKVHHDYIGGLLEHTLEVVEIALSIAKHYPMADKDLVVAGALLHDIGKIFEFKVEPTSFKRTKEGYLIGHIVLGVDLVAKKRPKALSEEEYVKLVHIILSHHHDLELGAVVRPATIEAAIVAMADYASSQVRQFAKELTDNKPNEDGFGEYHRTLKTRVYFGKPEIKEE